MAQDSAQERTEQPTPKRLRDARRKGQVARSRELATAALLLGGSAGIWGAGPYLLTGLSDTMRGAFTVERAQLADPDVLAASLAAAAIDALQHLGPFLALMFLLALGSPVVLGGWNFSTDALGPKWERMDPVKGLGRLFSVRALVELVKALNKFALVAGVAVAILWFSVDRLLGLGLGSTASGMEGMASLVSGAMLLLCLPILLLAGIDVPWQLWQHLRQLRMTQQEIRDEHKESEGRPEVKARIRRLQQQLAQRRMMEAVPGADVVITNPTHYAVALRYKADRDAAPVVVAKGTDLIALQIRSIATAHGVVTVESPPLARAIHRTTPLDGAVPAALYVAIAQILAHIYSLRAAGTPPKRPLAMPDVPVPSDLAGEPS
jgi:flagellar biosynthetic protein FlhB